MRHNLRYLRDPGRIIRKLRWVRIHRGPSRDITVDSWNGRLTVNSRDWFIGKSLFVDRAYEPETIAAAMKALEAGGWITRGAKGTVLDIGANIGMITTALLRHGWFDRAVCIEPSPANLRLLRLNLAQNELEARTTVLGVAMSSEPGELAFELSERNTGDNRVRVPGSAGTPGAFKEERRVEIKVPVDTLDHALAAAGVNATEVKLLWMDIQGFEGKCLEGASKTLAAGMPVILEFWPYGIARAGMARADYMAVLRRHFDRAFRIQDDGVVPLTLAEVDSLFEEVHQPNKMAQLLFVKGEGKGI